MKIIELNGTKHHNLAKVDDDDYEKLNQYKWHMNVRYASTYINGKHTSMHRMVTNCPADKIVDHINHDELDNRKENLRICDAYINMQNRRKGIGAIKKLQIPKKDGLKYTYWIGEVRRYHNRYITTTCDTEEQARGALKQLIAQKKF